jgi:hypothetical protein
MCNHCIYSRCAQCGYEYCLRCEAAICPHCGHGYFDAESITFETIIQMNTNEIFKAALALSADDRKALMEQLKQADKTNNASPAAGREVFCDFYLEHFGTAYYWVAKDYVALKQLLNKIKKKLAEQHKPSDENALLDSFKHLLKAIVKLDNDWYKQNFSMSVINSQFNVLYVKITTKKPGTVSNEYRDKILRDLQS